MMTVWFVRCSICAAAALAVVAAGCQGPKETAPPAPRPAPPAPAAAKPSASAPSEMAKPAAAPAPARPGAPATAKPAKPVATAKESVAVAAARKLGTPAGKPVVTTASGLQYIDLKAGGGAAAKAGDMVAVHYTGWLVDGAKFDSSVDRGEPLIFPLGRGAVIKGWDEGLTGMKPGGVRKLIIPPQLGYGSAGQGPIPANSTLIFEVYLVKIQK